MGNFKLFANRQETHQKIKKRAETAAEEKIRRQQEQLREEEMRARAEADSEDTLDDITANDEEVELIHIVAKKIDANRDGWVTREEFLEQSVKDESFMDMVENLDGDIVWGDLLIGQP